jgi:hypothetical protein
MDAKLGRQVLTHIEDNPKHFDVTVWGRTDGPGGEPAADIGGRALLLSGWTLIEDNTFLSPDGKREIRRPEEIEHEACMVLGLSEDEVWDGGDLENLFALPADKAVNRLRELVEQAEGARVNG